MCAIGRNSAKQFDEILNFTRNGVMSENNQSAEKNNSDWQVMWDEFQKTKRPDIGFMQSSWYLHVMEQFGWGYFDAFLLDDSEQIYAGGRVLVNHIDEKHVYFYMPDGPALSDDPAQARVEFEQIAAYIHHTQQQYEKVVTHLRIEPRWLKRPDFIDSAHEIASWDEPRDTLYIDLRPPEAEILANMKPKGRYNIKVAERHGVDVKVDNSSEGVENFLRLYQNTLSRKGVHALNTDYMRFLMQTTLGRNCSSVYFANYNNQTLAAAFIVYHGNMATYFWAGSSDQHSNIMAPYLLNFRAMQDAKGRGCDWYDFYGISPIDAEPGGLDNVTRFKSKFGGVEQRFVATMDFFFDEAGYEKFRIAEMQK